MNLEEVLPSLKSVFWLMMVANAGKRVHIQFALVDVYNVHAEFFVSICRTSDGNGDPMERTFGCPFKGYRVLYDYEDGSQERLHTVNSSGHQ